MASYEDDPITVLLLGDGQVGKSSWLARVSLGPGEDLQRSLPVLRDSDQPFVVDIHTPRHDLRLHFHDTATPENYTRVTPDLIILCYAVNSRTSLQNAQNCWKKQADVFFNLHEIIPVMLLGLKRDLRREGDTEVVFPQEALNTAQSMRCDRYAECSAETGELFPQAYEDVVKMAAASRMKHDRGRTPGWNPCIVM